MTRQVDELLSAESRAKGYIYIERDRFMLKSVEGCASCDATSMTGCPHKVAFGVPTRIPCMYEYFPFDLRTI